MSDSEENKGFKVIDRRGNSTEKSAPSGDSDAPKTKSQGEGFVMEDKEEAPQASPDQMDFSTLVFSFATGALIQLGLAPDPSTGQVAEKNVPLAKQNIEILEILHTKTKGNLSEDEGQLLTNLLTELRLRYVEASR